MKKFYDEHIAPFLPLNGQENPLTVQKMDEVLEYLSGLRWKKRANFEHFYEVVQRVYLLCSWRKLVDKDVYAAAGRLRKLCTNKRKDKGARYGWHHQMEVFALTLIFELSKEMQLLSFVHDDIEDLPKMLTESRGVPYSEEEVEQDIENELGKNLAQFTRLLTNPKDMPEGKHETQLKKMEEWPIFLREFKAYCDRMTQVVDDSTVKKGRKMKPAQAAQLLLKASELLHAVDKGQIRSDIRIFFAVYADRLYKRYNLDCISQTEAWSYTES